MSPARTCTCICCGKFLCRNIPQKLPPYSPPLTKFLRKNWPIHFSSKKCDQTSGHYCRQVDLTSSERPVPRLHSPMCFVQTKQKYSLHGITIVSRTKPKQTMVLYLQDNWAILPCRRALFWALSPWLHMHHYLLL